MSDENGGNFSGDGSVRWEIVSGDEVTSSSETINQRARAFDFIERRDATGARCHGLDHRIGREFVVSVRLPKGVPFARFIAGIKPFGNRAVFRVPLERVQRQIMIRWGKDPDLRELLCQALASAEGAGAPATAGVKRAKASAAKKAKRAPARAAGSRKRAR